MSEAIKGLENIEDIITLEDLMLEAKSKGKDEIVILPSVEKTVKETEKSTDAIMKPFSERIEDIMKIVNAVSGGVSVDSRIDPILRPKNWKTTTILTKGEVKMIIALIAFCKTSEDETECVLEYCEDFCYLKLSESGFAIEKAIDLGKALAEKTVSAMIQSPDKPTEGMKKK